MVTGHGYSNPKIMFIGDCASDADVLNGRALTDTESERFLAANCKSNGIHFQETYRTLLIKERGNLSKPKNNTELVTSAYREILKQEIDTLQPNIIVPLSELSFNFITGLNGIRKYRGSVLPTASGNRIVRAIPVLGPAPYLNEDPRLIFISRLDFSKIAKNQNEVGPIQEEGLLWIAKNAVQLEGFINRHYDKSEYLVFDIETYCGIPTCISLCFDGNESVTVPLIDRDIPLDDRVFMADLVARVLASQLPKVNQNMKFDWRKLARWGLIVNNVVGDTQINAGILYPEFPKNLGFLTSIYTDMPYHKDEGKEYDPRYHDRSRLYLYCAKDSLATHRIYSTQISELKETGTDGVQQMIMGIYPIYHQMETNGILISEEIRAAKEVKYWSLYEIELIKLSKLACKSIFDLTGEKGSLSDAKIRKLVYDDFGYTKIRGVKQTETGLLGVDEESLEILMWRGIPRNTDARESLRVIINIRKLKKVLEYLGTDIHPDGRMRSEFNLSGTKTGRTSASETTDCKIVIDGKKTKVINMGRSFQTIAKHGFEIEGVTLGKDLREMFVPSPGYAFVECDLSQAEARVDAVLAKDFEILKVFDSPTGIHRLTGSWVFSCASEDIRKNILVEGIDRYHTAKTVRHAGERNMRPDRLMMMIHKSIEFCTKVLDTFHKNQPNIREVFHKDIRNALQTHRSLRAPNGRKRDFFGRYNEDMINEGISQLPQSIVTDYLKQGLRRTFDSHPWARPLSEAHDGFLSEVPIGNELEYARTFVTNTQVPIDFRTCSLPRDFELTIPVEVESSRENWKNMTALKEF